MGSELRAEWFGPRLRELRTAAGLTREELASRAELAVAGLANLEQGRTSPAWVTVLKLCQALGVGCDAFTEAPSDERKPGRGRPRQSEPEPEKTKPTGKKRPKK